MHSAGKGGWKAWNGKLSFPVGLTLPAALLTQGSYGHTADRSHLASPILKLIYVVSSLGEALLASAPGPPVYQRPRLHCEGGRTRWSRILDSNSKGTFPPPW